MMKKLLLFVLFAPVFLSCSKEETVDCKAGGAISLTTAKNVDTDDRTRSTVPLSDLAGYSLILDGPDYLVMECPPDGKVEGLTPGDYIVELTNFTAAFVPAFDDPRYAGNKTVTVAGGKETPVTLTLTQANAGMRFVYDPSLAAAGLSDLTATVAQGTSELSFEDEYRDATGYFSPGEVTVALSNNGDAVTIGGQANRKYNLSAKELWTITLKVSSSGGGLNVTAEIDVTVDEIDEALEVDAGSGSAAKSALTVAGLGEGSVTVTFTDGSFTTVNLNAAGYGTVAGAKGQVIKSIAAGEGNEILIGRALGEEINLLVVGGAVTFRPAAGGVVPVGTVAELALINSGSASLAGDYRQEGDIDLMSEWWQTIGTASDPFTGTYDGAGFDLSNLYIKATNRQGLFGTVKDGTVKNVNIVSGSVEANDYVAAVCGYLDGESLIENCTNHVSVSAARSVGGIVGEISSSAKTARVSGCTNYGSVHGSYGGAGIAAAGAGIIENCANYGSVSGNQWTGGIASNSSAVIRACANHGSIVSYGNGTGCSGGIVGRGYNITVTACYNTGEVSGELNIGGIAGHFYKSSTGDAARLSACYNIGKVNGTAGEGALCGDVGDDGAFEHCYWVAVTGGAGVGVGNADPEHVKHFGAEAWPSATDTHWGIGNDPEAGRYWKSLGEYGVGYPALHWE